MHIVSIYRPENASDQLPFAGREIFAFAEDAKHAHRIIDKATPLYPDAHWHVETVANHRVLPALFTDESWVNAIVEAEEDGKIPNSNAAMKRLVEGLVAINEVCAGFPDNIYLAMVGGYFQDVLKEVRS